MSGGKSDTTAIEGDKWTPKTLMEACMHIRSLEDEREILRQEARRWRDLVQDVIEEALTAMSERDPETTELPGLHRLGMILSAYDQIAMDRRCDRERVCSASSMGFRVLNCQCYQDARRRVDRSEANV